MMSSNFSLLSHLFFILEMEVDDTVLRGFPELPIMEVSLRTSKSR